MNEFVPTVSVIVAARPEQDEIAAVAAAKKLDYPQGKLELLVARGRQPSVQRNRALELARGELIYFLDDDSAPEPANLQRAVDHFKDTNVKVVGGPSLCPPDAPFLEKVFALVLGSWLAFGPSRARYTGVGRVRPTTEKELILCNLLARRDTLIALGGFNEALYPNEENALMDAIQKQGGKLVYDPALIVYRRPRGTLGTFIKMLITYGRGRAEQFRVYPTTGSALNFVPPLFCVYLVILPVIAAVGNASAKVALAPLVLYALALLAQGAVLARHGGVRPALCALPLIALTHLLYGLGFWRGLFTKLKAPTASEHVHVKVETVPL